MSAWLSNDLRIVHPVCLTYTHLIATRGQRHTPTVFFCSAFSKVGVMYRLVAIPSELLRWRSPNHVVVDEVLQYLTTE